IAEQGSESQMGWDYQGSRFLQDIDFRGVGIRAAERAVSLLGAERVPSTKGTIILDNSVAADFLGVFSSALSADAVQKKKSMFAGKVGAAVIADCLSIVDSGLLPGKLGSRPFDDEGVAVSRTGLIDHGVLKGFLYNTYTARKDGVASTGNAVRGGIRGMPSVGVSNLYMDASDEKLRMPTASLCSRIDKGLLVTETMGMHTANPISGEFSVGVSGHWVESGKVVRPAKEAVISGNILELFRNVALVGDDLIFYGNIGAPSLLIEGIDISG
ncbi:MAG TPA: metallopeptidase TldD-related protein, partial [Dissulfurispiraceae bacterium]|nr:metallopeptidase TldD-related protein [Dissulfurispiraceae bacterium]